MNDTPKTKNRAMQFYPTDDQYRRLNEIKKRIEEMSFMPGETRITWSSYLRGLLDRGMDQTESKLNKASKI